VATTNAGKVREIVAILTEVPELSDIELLTLAEAGVPDFAYEETGATFAENAVGKAIAAATATGLPAIADDSGLCVDALGGAPGVHSARWAGEDATDDDRNAKLLEALEGVPESRRTARFVCAMAVALPSGKYRIAEGTCQGRISVSLKGASGFGYDPVFVVPALGRTLAELDANAKNAVSHRRAALMAVSEPTRLLLAELQV